MNLHIAAASFSLGLFVFASSAMAQDTNARNVFEDDGFCNVRELNALPTPNGIAGQILTLKPTQVFQTRGTNPVPTQTSIPPLTRLKCHHESGDKVLVSAYGDTPYCGWIDKDEVLQGRKSEGILGKLESDVCGPIQPLRIADFCGRLDELQDPTAECEDPSVKDSVFDAKFIVDNTGSERDATSEAISAIEVPLFQMPDSSEPSGAVTIFNVLQVFAVDRGPKDQMRYLLLSGTEPLGWIDAEAGQIWYSRLATFFKPGGAGSVLSDLPHFPDVEEIAGVAPNLESVIKNGPEFQRYPILQDNRQKSETVDGYKPNLRIAFIGAFCGGDASNLCSDIKETAPQIDFDLLNNTDILFLLDGTKSMQPYFDIVSNAVSGLAQDYVGNAAFQFGVSMYGDFLSPNATNPGDPMQYRSVIPLRPMLRGTEFSRLGATELYIKDALKDKSEPANAALLKAVQDTKWRGDNPRWIIHIADHGDRVPPSPALLKALADKKIFYAPIPVRGEAVLEESKAFVAHSKMIRSQHVTPNGAPLTIEPVLTYQGSQRNDALEFTAIGQALRGAMSFGEELREEAIRIAYDRQQQPTQSDRNSFPAGYADVKRAGLELFLTDFEGAIGRDDIKERTIAAVGYVQTAALGEVENDWSYYASMPPDVLINLQKSFERACVGFGDSNSGYLVAEAVLEILSILTGDPVQEDEFEEYFNDKSKIPLSTSTLLRGRDIIEMISDTRNSAKTEQNLLNQKEFCRSSTLLGLMINGRKLARPFDTVNGERGDLNWRQDSGTYSYRNPVAYDWIYQDDFGTKRVFLPLEFLPRYQRL